ncbi:DnaD domain protein [Gemella sp. GH3]|nr:DnaD domain protein [Gemella sp. GH3.1]NYS50156.1 DnaD domain protein [Gemella sp. GH3]
MKNLKLEGLYVNKDLLLNFNNYKITADEMLFLLQISYISEQGDRQFDAKQFSKELSITEEQLLSKLQSLYKKNIIKISETKRIIFLISNQEDNYYTLKELLSLTEKWVNRILTPQEIDIIGTWIDNKFTKKDIQEAFNISKSVKNIKYINSILNNTTAELNDDINEDDILNYDWIK